MVEIWEIWKIVNNDFYIFDWWTSKDVFKIEKTTTNILFNWGNVWIWTTTPSEKLEVHWWIRIQNASYSAESDLNNLKYWWIYDLNNPINKPSWSWAWWYVEVIQHFNWTDAPDWKYVLQRWTDLGVDDALMFYRVCKAGDWKAWKQISTA